METATPRMDLERYGVGAALNVYRSVVERFSPVSDWVGELRADLLLLDLETSGLTADRNAIVQLGVCSVEGGKVEAGDAIDLLIQTPYDPVVWGAVYESGHKASGHFMELARRHGFWSPAVREAIDANNGSIMGLDCVPAEIQEMADYRGRLVFSTASDIHGITAAKTMREGVPRAEAMTTVRDMIESARKMGRVVGGHNFVQFDLPWLCKGCMASGAGMVNLDDNQVLDTGMLVKAAQIGESPQPGESLCDFWLRVSEVRATVKWALDRYCVPTYGLDRKYGIDTSRQHASAAYDTWVTYCLLRELAAMSAN